MSANTLEQVKSLVTQLSLDEQEELIEYLNSRLAQNGVSQKKTGNLESRKMTLEDLWRMSDEISATEDSQSETMTQEFLRTRR